MRWVICSALVLAACSGEAPSPALDSPRAAMEALRNAYLARDGEAFLACVVPEHRQPLVAAYFMIPGLFGGKEPDEKLFAALEGITPERADLGRLFEIFDQHELAHRVFRGMPGGLESYKEPDDTFTYGIVFPGPWSFEEVAWKKGDEAIVQAHLRSGAHDIRVHVPLLRIDGRWFVSAPTQMRQRSPN